MRSSSRQKGGLGERAIGEGAIQENREKRKKRRVVESEEAGMAVNREARMKAKIEATKGQAGNGSAQT